MELSQLRYFCAVAETQHVTQTAERLHIAQPALTQSIRRLERELGVPLFAPKGRGIELTAYGSFLYRKLAPVLKTLEQLPRELAAMADLERDTIHMNVLAASTLLTASVIAYKRQRREAHFQLLQSGEAEHCDLTVYTALPDQALPSGGPAFYCEERFYLAVPRGGPYAGRTAIRLEEAAGEEFILLGGSYRQLRALCDRFCAQAGFRPKVIFESDSPATVRNLIAAGVGVGFWPEFTWGAVDEAEVLLLPIESPDCRRRLVVRCGQGREAKETVQRYYRFLEDYFRSFADVQEV